MASIDTDKKADQETKEQKATRRQLLKLAGAAVAGAAGSAALRAIPAAAADGDPMTVGIQRTEPLPKVTGVTNTTALGTANTALFGYSFNDGVGVHAKTYYGAGIASYHSGVHGTGILAYGATAGIVGASSATAVSGVSGYGIGVLAQTNATNSRALYAYTASTSVAVRAVSLGGAAVTAYSGAASGLAPGVIALGRPGAVVFSSYSGMAAVVAVGKSGGPDIKAAGSGRIVQVGNILGGTGAPNFTPAAGYFEMVRAKDGAMWINRGGASTGQAQWKRLNAVRVDTSDGTGNPFSPFRVYDSRSGPKKLPGSTTVVTIAGAGSGASKIPDDAIAVIGNLTATQYTGTGFLSIAPAGVAVGTSAVNFITGQTAIANGFIVGLGTGGNLGKLQVKVAGHSSHILIDITGYFQ